VRDELSNTVDDSDDKTDSWSTDTGDQDNNFIMSKDGGIRWHSVEPCAQKKHLPADIVRKSAGRASKVEPLEAGDSFQLFFDDSTLYVILHATEKEAHSVCSEKSFEHVPFTLQELKAFIGLVIVVGVTISQNESIDQLWSNEWGGQSQEQRVVKRDSKNFFGS